MSASRSGDTFTCAREPGNHHATLMKLSKASSVGHVPDMLARDWLSCWMLIGEIMHMEGTITSVPRSLPEGVWVLGRGIEIFCEYGCEKRQR